MSLASASVSASRGIASYNGMRKAQPSRQAVARKAPVTRTSRDRGACVVRNAIEMDSDTLFAVGAGVLGLAAGIAIPVWYEVQTVRSVRYPFPVRFRDPSTAGAQD